MSMTREEHPEHEHHGHEHHEHHDHAAAVATPAHPDGQTHDAHAGHATHDAHTAHDEHATHAAHDAHAGHGGGHMAHAGHGDHAGQFRRLFWIMLVLAVPTILFSPMFAAIIGYQLPDNALIPWISPVLGTVLYFWGGRPFLTGARRSSRHASPG